VLVLSGSSSVANYQAALRSVTYTNNSHAPTTTARTVTFIVNDGAANSVVVSRTITLTAVNDAPVNAVPGTQTTPRSTAKVIAMSISDVDAGSSIVQVQLSVTSGTLTLPVKTGLTFVVGDGTTDATMTFTGTIANINLRLATATFNPTNVAGSVTLQIVTNDKGFTGTGGALTDTDAISITVT